MIIRRLLAIFSLSARTGLLLVAVTVQSWAAAGSVFITGHDPIWHSNFGGNSLGAQKLATAGIQFARNGSLLPFLFVESKTVGVPGGNAHEAPFLTSRLGYAATDFVVMDAANLNALSDFRTSLNLFSAIVVASDHGGMLTGAELSFLNNHSADIIDYINAGGGLFAGSESNAAGLLGSNTPFGFLPFLVTSTSFQSPETSNTVTAFGAGLGLVNADVNGNFSHNYFSSTGGMTAVDLFNGNPAIPLTLASRTTITNTGVVPDSGATFVLTLLGLAALGAVARRRS